MATSRTGAASFLRVWLRGGRAERGAPVESAAVEPAVVEPAVVEPAAPVSVERWPAQSEPGLVEGEPDVPEVPAEVSGVAAEVPRVVVEAAPRGVTSELVATEEALAEIARQRATLSDTLTFYFVCCSNQSLIRSLYDLLRVAAPAHGGCAAMFAGDRLTIDAHRQEAGALSFDGRRHIIREVTDVATVAEAMSAVQAAGYQDVFVAVAGMGPSGREQMEELYRASVRQAFKQGIMPFPMFETESRRAAQFLVGACRKLAGDDLPGEQPGRHRG